MKTMYFYQFMVETYAPISIHGSRKPSGFTVLLLFHFRHISKKTNKPFFCLAGKRSDLNIWVQVSLSCKGDCNRGLLRRGGGGGGLEKVHANDAANRELRNVPCSSQKESYWFLARPAGSIIKIDSLKRKKRKERLTIQLLQAKVTKTWVCHQFTQLMSENERTVTVFMQQHIFFWNVAKSHLSYMNKRRSFQAKCSGTQSALRGSHDCWGCKLPTYYPGQKLRQPRIVTKKERCLMARSQAQGQNHFGRWSVIVHDRAQVSHDRTAYASVLSASWFSAVSIFFWPG